VASRRALYEARTALWITLGWVVASLLVHWIVRRVPTYAARELTATATGVVVGLASAWFELRAIPARCARCPRVLSSWFGRFST